MSPLGSRDELTGTSPVLSRRRLLQGVIGAGGIAAIGSLLAACSSGGSGGAGAPPGGASGGEAATTPAAATQAGPGGFANVGSLKLLMSSHFVPHYDVG